MGGHRGQPVLHVVQQALELGVHGRPVGLVIHAVQHGLHRRPHALRGHGHQIRRVMGAAALPHGPGQVRRHCFHEAAMGVRGHQCHPGQPPGHQVREELVPRRTRLRGGHPQPEDFAAPVGVDPGGDHGHRVDHPPALSDFHGQGVGGEEHERAGLAQRPVTESLDVLVQLLCHPADLGLRERVDAELTYELVHAPGRDPGQVAVRDHGDQCGLGPFAALEEPFGEVRAGPEFGDGHIDRAGAGVQGSVPVAVALCGTALGGLAVLGAADRVRVGGEQCVDHGLQQVAQQVWGGLPESFAQQAFRVDNVWSGHRGDVLSRVLWKVRSKAPTVTASVKGTVLATGEGYTTIRDSTGLPAESHGPYGVGSGSGAAG